jgi:hypothetical protein
MPEPFEPVYVERGYEAAIERAKRHGIPANLNPAELDLLKERMKETAISKRQNGTIIRWNTRAIQLLSELIAIGMIARRHHGFEPLKPAEIDEAIKDSGKMVNSFRHR